MEEGSTSCCTGLKLSNTDGLIYIRTKNIRKSMSLYYTSGRTS